MLGVLKENLIIVFVVATVVGGILTRTLPIFNNKSTTVSQAETSNSNIEGNYIEDVTVDTKDANNNDANDTDKNVNSLFDIENSNNNSQSNNGNTNNKETISLKLEELNNSDNTNKQETISPKLEETSNSDNTNKQETIIPNLEKPSNSNNENKQETIKSNLEVANNSNNTNKQSADNSQLKDTNSNENTESMDSANTTLDVKMPTISYDRTTSIYANDNITLLRVEYYKNNKLTYYSVVEQFDATTKSYIEKIYQCNRETNIDPLIRTDEYINGKLIKSY